MKKFLAILMTLIMVFALAACGGSTTDTETTETDGVSANADITILDFADISTLYPLDLGTTSDQLPVFLAYDGLLRMDGDQNYVWMLASGCEMSEDGLEYVFTLREGITFSDGTPWNAEAAKANLDIMADQSNGLKSQYMFAAIDSVEVVDEYTVKVTLSEVYAPFLNALATEMGAMVSPSLLSEDAQTLASSVVGTGQYTLVERKTGEYTKYQLNPDWWGYDADICGGTPIAEKGEGFNTITIRPISEESTRVAMLMSGEADIVLSLTPSNMTQLEAQDFTIYKEASTAMSYFYFNCQKDVFKDVRVRQAIAMAIDRGSLNDVVYGGDNEIAESPLTPSIKYFEAQTPYEYDVEAAKALLAEAGYPDGFTVVCWEENDTTDIQRGEFIQQQLEQIGITLEVYPQEGGFLTENVNAYSGDAADTEFDCYIRGYATDTADADGSIGRFASTAFPPMGGNYSFYTNDEYDAAIAQGASSIDDEVRADAYSKAQKIFWEDVPAVCLLCTTNNVAYNSHISGVELSAAGILHLTNSSYVE